MALRGASLSTAIYDFLPHALNSPRPFQMRTATQLYRCLSSPLLPSAALSIPSISLNIPDLLGGIWEGILKAVPKKKTSHMKKRHRQLAGKALKDVNSVNTCPGCGKPKKAHHLCPYCVEGSFRPVLWTFNVLTLAAEIKQSWKQAAKTAKEDAASSGDV